MPSTAMRPVLRLAVALALLASLSPLATAQGLEQGHDCRNPQASAALPPAACLRALAPQDGPSASGLIDSHVGFEAVEDEYVRFGPGFSVLGPASTSSFVNGADFMGGDFATWYALDYSGRAYTVDVATGAETALGRLTPAVHWGDMAWDATTGQFYAIASDCATGTELYTVDFATRTATLIGASTSVPCGVGLAIDPNTGTAYVHEIVDDAIHTMDKATGATTQLGPTGFDANYAQSMDFDDASGTLYLYAFNFSTYEAELRTVDLATGATTLVGTIAAGRDITAASSGPLPPVDVEPPPAAAALDLTVHPNPLRAWSTVTLTLGHPTHARVSVHDVLGREVLVLHEGSLSAGAHALGLDAAALPAGTYLVRLATPEGERTRAITLQ